MNMHALRFTAFVGLMIAAACSSSSDTPAPDGSGGSTGDGSGGSGGNAVSSSTGGQGGAMSVGGGGEGGQGGESIASAECVTDEDCELIDSCCDCAGVPKGDELPCQVTECLLSVCAQFNPQPVKSSCRAGQCVTSVDCDISKVTCKSLPPDCPEGQTNSVDPGTSCWGPCIAETECSEVATCDQCVQNACVTYQTQMGPKRHCVELPAICTGSEDCDCFGPAVCAAPFDTCAPSADGLLCSCSSC